MGKPIGESFTVTIDGAEVTHVISPRVLSNYMVDNLLAIYREERRNKQYEVLSDLYARVESGQVPERMKKVLEDRLVEELTGEELDPGEDINKAINTLMNTRGQALALHTCCDTVGSLEDAARLVDAYPNSMELFALLLQAGMEGMESAKNSENPDPKGGEETNRSSTNSPETKPTQQ